MSGGWGRARLWECTVRFNVSWVIVTWSPWLTDKFICNREVLSIGEQNVLVTKHPPWPHKNTVAHKKVGVLL